MTRPEPDAGHAARTLFDKIWDAHVAGRRSDGRDLLYIDRHVVHELHAPHAFAALERSGRRVRRPGRTVVVQDHTVPTRPGLALRSDHIAATEAAALRHGVTAVAVTDEQHGISHVVSPERGWALPGATLACPDSHASTVGALGCLAFGCGTSELVHILCTQTMALDKPRQMRLRLDGPLGFGVGAKDLALHLIRSVGIEAGRGFAVEYTGSAVEALGLEGRMTLCNMTIEWGARTCLVAPDAHTLAWLQAHATPPEGQDWPALAATWGGLASDAGARFDEERHIDCSAIGPQISWGTDPSQCVSVDEPLPAADTVPASGRERFDKALAYMGLQAGQPLLGLAVQRVFIGSCANARLDDLREAAAVVRGRHVAPGVRAAVVPGSNSVKRQAEGEGLAQVFIDAGFEWHRSGCSMCAGANGDIAAPGERCLSTTNRNFENRQGRGVRTHLVGPAMAAAAALAGHIVDLREGYFGSARQPWEEQA
jgi:3-isopropylmalate/(R)-2-methylmalate dehydratase large subunit